MKLSMDILVHVLMIGFIACVLCVLVLGMLGFDYPESDLFAGVVGFSMREITQCLNNYYNQPKGE